MRYISPLGTTCTYADAHASGSLRPGYRTQLEEGGYISFDLALVDSKPAPTMTYLTDSAHDRTRAELLSQAAAASAAGKMVRDAVMDRRAGVPPSIPASAATPSAGSQAIVSDGEAIRDMMRRNRNA